MQSLVNSELVMLPINHLLQMKREFYSEWEEMMTNAYQRLSIECQLKI